MTELRKNKAAQFISGCFAIFCVFKLYQFGFFDRFLSDGAPEGYESATLVGLALSAAYEAVCMVGIIALVGGGYIATHVIDWLGKAFSFLRVKAAEISQRLPKPSEQNESSEQSIDGEKLAGLLDSLMDRLDNLEAEAKTNA